MIMAKDLCKDKKSWLEKFSAIAKRIDNIISEAKTAVKKMFSKGTTDGLSDDKKKRVRFNRDKKNICSSKNNMF